MSDQCATCGAADVILFTCGYCGREFCADHDLPHHSCEGFAHPGEGVDEVTFEWETGGRTDPDDAFTESGFRPATEGTETAGRSSMPRSAPAAATPAVEPAPRSTEDGATPAATLRPRRIERPTTPAVTPAPRTVEPAAAAVERRPRTNAQPTTPAIRPAPRRPSGPTVRAVQPAPSPEPEPESTAAAATTAPVGPGPEPTAAATASASDESSASGHIRTMDAKRSPGAVERRDPQTLTEWLDQQTYVSLSVKTAALATVINGALYLGMMVTLYGLLPV